MAEKGRKPAMHICGTAERYHGMPGTSRGILVVRHGALNSCFVFLPAMPVADRGSAAGGESVGERG
eukprot:7115787-Pyramimonas_sp.AAC.1